MMEALTGINALWGLVVAGIAGGILSGISGIGGGVVIVPMLIYFFGYTTKMAQGTTLALLSMPVCAIAAWSYYQRGESNPKAALIIAAGFIFGSLFGAKVAAFIPELWSRRIFAVILLGLGIKMLAETFNKTSSSI